MSAHPTVPATLHRAWAADLTPARLYELLRLRINVFVIEQNCPYQELDGRDLEQSTRHFWVEPERPGEPPQATLRLLEDPDGGFHIGRVCTSKSARGRGLSRRLMEAALAEIGDARCVLDSQVPVKGLYERFGFTQQGEEFLEDGIPHITMVRVK
ncbi:MAG TPA: GNAT family N-acetyltransferase [Pseudonocardiaceae bacterium]|nr:GNAT family N-acetyltransferase [Pseudonocardiaceae bacterium]